MCGVCGFYNEDNKRLLDEMCEALAYRGPDDRGTFSAGPVDLGMTRLEKLLREVVRGLLPEAVIKRRTLDRGYFKAGAIRALLNDFTEGGVGGRRICSLFSLELWHRKFLDDYLPAHFRLDDRRCGILS